jgi:hypothetical protein
MNYEDGSPGYGFCPPFTEKGFYQRHYYICGSIVWPARGGYMKHEPQNLHAIADLLAFVLMTGRGRTRVSEAIHTLLRDYDMQWIRNASVDELQQVAGLTRMQATRLHAIIRLTTHFAQLERGDRRRIETSLDAVSLLHTWITRSFVSWCSMPKTTLSPMSCCM